MCLFIWTVFSGERCGPWASCYYLLSSFHLHTLYSKLLHIYLLFSCNNKPIFLYVVFSSFSYVFYLFSISFSIFVIFMSIFEELNYTSLYLYFYTIQRGMFINIYIHIQHQPNGDGFISLTTCFRIMSVIHFVYVIYNAQWNSIKYCLN